MRIPNFIMRFKGSKWIRIFLWNAIFAYFPGSLNRARLFKFLFSARIGHNTRFWQGIRVDGIVDGNIEIGSNCVLVRGLFINCPGGLKIGDNVFFGHDVSLYGADHDPDLASMPARYRRITIASNVWIASKASILKGVQIGEGAIIAYSAVVTRNVDAFSIVGGVPAKFIRYRDLGLTPSENNIDRSN